MMQFMKYSIFIFISIHHASSETGCLFDTRICKTNELCFDDGFIGSCHDAYDVITFIQSQNVPITQYKSMSRRNINPDLFYQTKSSQLKESLTDSAESAVGRELRKLLSKSGTRAPDLTTSEQLELARLILNDYGGGGGYRASKKDAGWLMRLVTTISRVRDNLHDQHVTIAQLSDRQLRFLSLAVAKSFLRHEQEREHARSRAELSSEQEVPADSNLVVEDVEVPTPVDAQQQQQQPAAASINGHAPTIVGSNQRVPKVEKNVPATDPPKAGRSAAAAAVPPVVAPPENILPTTSPVRHSKQANIPPTKLKKVDGGAGADNDVLVVVGIVASVAALVIIVTVGLTIYCMRRGARAGGGKLFRGNPSDDDYQELCRQRYASKATEQRSESQDSTQPLINKNNQFAAGSTMKRVFSPGGGSGGSKRGPAESRLQRLSSVASNSSAGSWSEEPVTTSLDISTGHAILSYMEDHLRNHERLDEEWTALCSYTADDESFAVARANCSKNRSDLVLPYDDNRVVIEKSENPMESDYINASLIIDNDPKAPLYIAAQGPLPSTIHQFWQMIWEQGSVAIVMLTPTVEEAALQCARYWPDEGSVNYNNFEIHLVSEHIWCEDYLVRSLYLKNLASGETRTLTQFHFLSWPHNGIPPSPKPLLELRRKVVKCYRGTNTPVVVHCSNGAGRTGTYILIDLAINRMLKGAKEMDIAATLEHLRDQRHGLVDSKDQLRFALSCVAEEVNAILKLALVKKQPEPSL